MTRVEHADWTRSPAAIFASVVLGVVGIAGVGWSWNRTIERDHLHDSQAIGPTLSGSGSGGSDHASGNNERPTRAFGSGRASEPPPMQAIKRIDLNEADSVELQLLPRIGPTLASRIIADRQEHGAFGSVEELARVKGIGLKTVEKLKAFVILGESPETRASADEGG